MTFGFTRRAFAQAFAAAGGVAVLGCGASRRDEAGGKQTADRKLAAEAKSATSPNLGVMTVYRDPSCGCCEAWAEIVRTAGYRVRIIDHPDMPAIKRQFGVPEALASCHTAIVDGYAIEGHVPIDAMAQLLKERPVGTRGIAVPGMPRGSPGMEMPDGAKDTFQVIAFDATGQTTVYSTS